MKIGDRVGAIASIRNGVAEIFGFGTYKGALVPNHKDGRGTSADLLKEADVENPTIELDNGELIYGCECWWASEEKIQEMIGKCTEVKIVTIHDLLAKESE